MGDNGKVYIGDLGDSGNEGEIEHAFKEFGNVRSVWVSRNPPGFAFVEFEEPRDAEQAIMAMNGQNLCGQHVRVSMARPKRGGGGGGYRGGGGGGYRGGGGGYGGGGGFGGGGGGDNSCRACGEQGHFARNCPNSGGGGGGGYSSGGFGGGGGGYR